MKQFKNFFAALLALTMILSLAACGGANDDTAAEDDGSGETETTMYKIGISQYGDRLLDNCEGFIRVWSRLVWWRAPI
jgi:uncharacterized lipoprotein YehR (DUF1307 family)